MPCNMYEGVDWASSDAQDAQRRAKEATEKADQLTRILCHVLRYLPPEMVAGMDPGVGRWFEDHKRHDAKNGR